MASSYEMYQEQILDHYKRPRNKGVLQPASHHAKESNPLCGDEIAMTVQVDGSERIADVRFDGQGCAISQASASMLTVSVKGKPVSAAKALSKEDMLTALGIPLSAVRMKCALLSLHTLRKALGETSPDA
ncbi:MAG TPA: SUF system NifU family Fe-S cluster assembly protein [Thermoplasmata archaeon]|nr:SUF system NifU family Fe-S cluster assembly protein [Thermoplasmata archaeon]